MSLEASFFVSYLASETGILLENEIKTSSAIVYNYINCNFER